MSDVMREALEKIAAIDANHGGWGWARDIAREALAQAEQDAVYSQGICGDGAAILKDGQMMTVDEIVAALNAKPSQAEQRCAVALTFDRFRAANVARCIKWHPQGIDSWSPSDWLVAVTGELGELASLLKMRNRERDGLPGNKFSPTDKQIADELADVLTYLDLLAAVLGVDLGRAAVEKFNEVSGRVGFPDRIDLAAPQAPVVPDEVAKMRDLLRRYRTETPLCHQPHMIAIEVDELLAAAPEVPRG